MQRLRTGERHQKVHMGAYQSRFTAALVAGIGLSGAIALAPMSASWAIAPSEVPNPREANGTWVADTADLLSPESEDQLNQMISELEVENGTEIAVVTVTNTSPSPSPKAFATELFNTWEIGKAEADNGVLFLVSEGDLRTEIEVGYGLEGVLTDAQAGQILRNEVMPEFKAGDFDAGLLQGTETLVAVLSGNEAPPVLLKPEPKRDYSWVRPLMMLAGLYALGYLFSRGNRDGGNNDHHYHDNSSRYSGSSYFSSGHSSSSHSGFGGGSDFGGGSSGGGGAGDSW